MTTSTAEPTKPVYLDHHATTPVDPRVLEAMLPYFTERFGNAASIHHAYGWEAEESVEAARADVAAIVGAEPSEVVWTSGATEANNLAIKGAARAAKSRGDHLVVSGVEHRAALDPMKRLAREEGFRLAIVPPDPTGRIAPEAVLEAIEDQTVLVSVMAANNEIGTINPIGAIAQLCRQRDILFHTDASQLVGKGRIDFRGDGIDLLSLTAHKFHGPKGIGALVIRRKGGRVPIQPLFDGGGHEFGLRSGTLPVPLIVGLGRAAAIAQQEGEADAERMARLRDRLEAGLRKRLGDDRLQRHGHPTERLPNNLNVGFKGVSGDALMMNLQAVAVSSGSACSSSEPEPSQVLRAVGVPEALAEASIRFGLGRFTTEDEIDVAIGAVADAVERCASR